MSARVPALFRPLMALALLLSLGACGLFKQSPSAEAIAQMQAVEVRNAWLDARNQAIEQLRQDPHLSVTEQANGDLIVRIRSGNVFSTASTLINPQVQPVLEHIAATLVAQPLLSVSIIGHTDDVGDPQYNLALSARRAESVHDALVSLGVEAHRLSREGRGDAEPIVPNTSPEGHAVNRRVDLLIPAWQSADTGNAESIESTAPAEPSTDAAASAS